MNLQSVGRADGADPDAGDGQRPAPVALHFLREDPLQIGSTERQSDQPVVEGEDIVEPAECQQSLRQIGAQAAQAVVAHRDVGAWDGVAHRVGEQVAERRTQVNRTPDVGVDDDVEQTRLTQPHPPHRRSHGLHDRPVGHDVAALVAGRSSRRGAAAGRGIDMRTEILGLKETRVDDTPGLAIDHEIDPAERAAGERRTR